MSFEVDAAAYGEFMGRYSEPLAAEFAAFVKAEPGQRALDVGSGPGALTAVLVERLGAQAVAAVDPSAAAVSAIRCEVSWFPPTTGACGVGRRTVPSGTSTVRAR